MDLPGMSKLSGMMDLPGMNQVEDCMDTFKIMPENILKFLGNFKTDSNESGKKAYGIIKYIGAVLLFLCVFPALPFFFILAIMIATMKYIVLKFGNL